MKTKLHLALTALLAAALALPVAGADGGKKKQKRNADGKVDLASEIPTDAKKLNIGDAAPDFKLLGIDGQTYTLASFKSAPLLMVVFLSNHCPYSHAAETRLLPLAREFKSKGLEVVAINPNSPDGIRLDEL